jgi:APA family basic amino acid/polyamine antiporter
VAPTGKISLLTATCLVVANMVGTGVFTSLGLQAVHLRSPFLLIGLWVLGGIFALCGALCYGELASALHRSGGEYHFLSKIYHPGVGFVAGWISGVVGFAAPLALAAMAFGKYVQAAIPAAPPLACSIAIVALTALAHLFYLRFGALFQNTFTLLKLVLILVFLAAGFLVVPQQTFSLIPASMGELAPALSAPFAVSLIYVMYAYSGWNASVYIAQEIDSPEKNLPKSLFLGTLLVTLLYVTLNWVFLRTTPLEEIAGQIDVGAISAAHVFGPIGGRLVSGLIALSLVSCISAMTWAGPRVWQVMGEDYQLLKFLAQKSRSGVPATASLFQFLLVLVLLVSSTFESVLVYAQFTLGLCAFLTVLGVLVLRRKNPSLRRPYRTWGYPFTPLAFLFIGAATMIYMIRVKPMESLAGLATMVLGLFLYLASPRAKLASRFIRRKPHLLSHEHHPNC